MPNLSIDDFEISLQKLARVHGVQVIEHRTGTMTLDQLSLAERITVDARVFLHHPILVSGIDSAIVHYYVLQTSARRPVIKAICVSNDVYSVVIERINGEILFDDVALYLRRKAPSVRVKMEPE